MIIAALSVKIVEGTYTVTDQQEGRAALGPFGSRCGASSKQGLIPLSAVTKEPP
jgi:hypothetical protein